MFGSGKMKELESRLISTKLKLEEAEKANKDLDQQLKTAKNRIRDLEKQLKESDGIALQEPARKTIVEYEGLKGLYIQKTKEIEDIREKTEESFAVEAANKRHDLSEEIRINREENQTLVSQTVQTFAGSYQYYLDQIRGLMDALSAAAKETGESLFAGDELNIKERFGTRILEHLQSNANAMKQDNGDLMLIGAEEPAPAAEDAAADFSPVPDAVEETAAETAELPEDAAECAPEEPEFGIGEAAEDTAGVPSDETAGMTEEG